jgi:hypothetical protein
VSDMTKRKDEVARLREFVERNEGKSGFEMTAFTDKNNLGQHRAVVVACVGPRQFGRKCEGAEFVGDTREQLAEAMREQGFDFAASPPRDPAAPGDER